MVSEEAVAIIQSFDDYVTSVGVCLHRRENQRMSMKIDRRERIRE